MVYNGYYKVMSNIPKMGQLPTPEKGERLLGSQAWWGGKPNHKHIKHWFILSMTPPDAWLSIEPGDG